ncbi:MAG: EAL domain-containing protein [Ruminococcus sp.]|nr:EAL domain-containing protein [Candidatus Apopatosoma intestinale]
MRRALKNNLSLIIVSFVVILGLILIMAAFSMLQQYNGEMTDQAAVQASYYTQSAEYSVKESILKAQNEAVRIADAAASYTEIIDLENYFYALLEDRTSNILLIRYYKDGVLYSSRSEVYEGYDGTRAVYETRPAKPMYFGTFEDTATTTGHMSIVGFYVPVEGSSLMDAMTVCYTKSRTETFFHPEAGGKMSEFTVLCVDSGEIVAGYREAGNNHVLNLLRDLVGDRQPIDEIKGLMNDRRDGTVSLFIDGEPYLVSVGADAEVMNDLCVVELYRVKTLCQSGIEFIDAIIGIFSVFVIMVVLVVIYLIVHLSIVRREHRRREVYDSAFGCATRKGFEEEVEKILARHSGNSYFSVIVFQLRHIQYLKETYGENETNRILSYLNLVNKRFLQREEFNGYMGDGDFLLLLHAKDREALLDRLKTHLMVATRYHGGHSFDIRLKYGIYEQENGERASVAQMVDYAIEANNAIVRATDQNATMLFNFYSSELRKLRQINDNMELRMEGALKNGEFQVFYQPKFNLTQNRQDGAEALVRWFDPKTNEYNRPALFMPLFENNGFIVKLDKYVYAKVCEYISYSLAGGRKVYPVSVNVSRITAVQDDFIEYYTRIKKEYGITDGQIMIEFTESFAYENYDALMSITSQLHKNGFQCSIDDFGSGYSSYRILKSLPMDEIKLDKFFIDKGSSVERDTYVIKSIIEVAKKLGMKVTQEGVEESQDVARLREMGCDVVQGYVYAHPMPLSDYISFVAHTRDHDLR